MAVWSTPKTWNVGDVLTAADMNTYVRDNEVYLKARLIAGGVDATGTVALGSGFSSSRTGVGAFTVTFTAAFPVTPGVVISHGIGAATQVGGSIITAISASAFSVSIRDLANTAQDDPFTFIAAVA